MTTMTQMLGQMMWWPVSMFAGWTSMLAAMTRSPCCQGNEAMNGPGMAPGTGFPERGIFADKPSAQGDGATKEIKEDRKMSDCCCCDDDNGTIKLMQYSIVSIKRCEEDVLCQGEIVDNADMTPEAFATWIVALYLQNELKQCPKKDLTKDDKKYLRVYSRVLESWPRQSENCCGDSKQVIVLREIAEAIKSWRGPGSEPTPEPLRRTPATATV
jgi:hypothetical protein